MQLAVSGYHYITPLRPSCQLPIDFLPFFRYNSTAVDSFQQEGGIHSDIALGVLPFGRSRYSCPLRLQMAGPKVIRQSA